MNGAGRSDNMDKREALDWLYGIDLHSIILGMDKITELLNRLGNPQDSFLSIHVAGSDGKGSTCAMLASVLSNAGIRTGMYTSPHIMEFNERISISGVPISDDDLADCISVVRKEVESMRENGMDCTFFEITTAIAFLYFKKMDVEYAVIEVGMGGRYDATNVIVPEVSIITNISMEHTDFLGDSIEKIAYQKAGIIKEGVPVVTVNRGAALDVIRDVAYGMDSELIVVSKPEIVSLQEDCTVMRYDGKEYTIGIPGDYQAMNASMVLEALAQLSCYEDIYDKIDEGLRKTVWPCRLQKIKDVPLIIDVSHTFEGSKIAFRNVSKIYGSVTAVFGLLSDKDIEGVSKNISTIASKVIVTVPDTPRAADPEKVRKEVSKYVMDVEFVPDVADAIDRAMEIRGDENILVTGSFYMAEGAMEWLKRTYAGY